MAQQTTKTERVEVKRVGTAAPVVTPEVVPLREIIKQIRRDSRMEPGAYLAATTVPFGGE